MNVMYIVNAESVHAVQVLSTVTTESNPHSVLEDLCGVI